MSTNLLEVVISSLDRYKGARRNVSVGKIIPLITMLCALT